VPPVTVAVRGRPPGGGCRPGVVPAGDSWPGARSRAG